MGEWAEADASFSIDGSQFPELQAEPGALLLLYHQIPDLPHQMVETHCATRFLSPFTRGIRPSKMGPRFFFEGMTVGPRESMAMENIL